MSLDEASLLADVRARLFAASPPTLTIGAEVELIPRFETTGAPALVGDGSDPTLIETIRAAAKTEGWKETSDGNGPPSWDLADGGRISFEPGGQIEVSSPPHRSCSALAISLQKVVAVLEESAASSNIVFHAVGVDPFHDIEAIPLQLGRERYVRMTRYLEARGASGIRMMRQTAALQISVEHGPRPLERWKLLNALSPYLIAIFANSSRYAGRETGHASYRAHFWRELDSSRTGVPFDDSDPAARYTSFALDAGALRAENGRGEFHPFKSLLGDPTLTMEDWHFHLSTLFPEIRPKEYFEIRSPDAIAVKDLAVPLAFVAGLVYDDDASGEALALLGTPDEEMLRSAGREGLANLAIRSRAAELARIAECGASRLPADYLSREDRARLREWLALRLP